MPFKSKAQQRACYASGGFDGAVKCKEWAKKTNFGKIPEKIYKPKRTKHS